MADTDEELVRKLHLEINGLSRPRRARVVHEVPGTHPVRLRLHHAQPPPPQAFSDTLRVYFHCIEYASVQFLPSKQQSKEVVSH